MSRRSDAIGMFWEDHAKVKPPKVEKVKRTPPHPFWLEPDYLPNYEQALAYKPDLFSDMELLAAQQRGERLSYDIEIYPNYALFSFKGIDCGKVLIMEVHLDPLEHHEYPLDIPKLTWVLHNFCIVNFNGRKYDFPVTTLVLAGHYDPEQLWDATVMLIAERLQPKEVYKKYKTHALKIDQIDLIELTALAPGLKVCAGRLHAPRLQDLPFKPGTYLTQQQIVVLRYYNINDLDNTIILHNSLIEQIQLREAVGKKYNIDLRSHSDAQMAEAIMSSEIRKLKRIKYLPKPVVNPAFEHKYKPPAYIRFQTPLMNHVMSVVTNAVFKVDGFTGEVIPPKEFDDLVIRMGNSNYKVGIGGMHTQEKNVAHVADDEYEVIDTDVTSYYPFLILNAGLAPAALGVDFLRVFRAIVEARVKAKAAGDTVTADSLKIVINGTFGKLGSKWSIMYSPDLLLQVTLTGQLSILMLAEACELNGIEVCSVNTDGIVVKCHKSKREFFNSLVKWWEQATGLNTEETRYCGTYSKDVNNYIAVYEKPQKGELFKTKGLYAKTSSKKNAVNEVCIDAVKAFIQNGTAPDVTIRACREIKKFTTMRAVSGGAVKMSGSMYDPNASVQEMLSVVQKNGWVPWHADKWIHQPSHQNLDEGCTLAEAYKLCCPVTQGEYLGKLIRWYYAVDAQGEIISAKTGNKVARTDNAKPLMNLPSEFPTDINYQWYVDEANKILKKVGYLKDGPVVPDGSEEEEEDDEEETA